MKQHPDYWDDNKPLYENMRVAFEEKIFNTDPNESFMWRLMCIIKLSEHLEPYMVTKDALFWATDTQTVATCVRWCTTIARELLKWRAFYTQYMPKNTSVIDLVNTFIEYSRKFAYVSALENISKAKFPKEVIERWTEEGWL